MADLFNNDSSDMSDNDNDLNIKNKIIKNTVDLSDDDGEMVISNKISLNKKKSNSDDSSNDSSDEDKNFKNKSKNNEKHIDDKKVKINKKSKSKDTDSNDSDSSDEENKKQKTKTDSDNSDSDKEKNKKVKINKKSKSKDTDSDDSDSSDEENNKKVKINKKSKDTDSDDSDSSDEENKKQKTKTDSKINKTDEENNKKVKNLKDNILEESNSDDDDEDDDVFDMINMNSLDKKNKKEKTFDKNDLFDKKTRIEKRLNKNRENLNIEKEDKDELTEKKTLIFVKKMIFDEDEQEELLYDLEKFEKYIFHKRINIYIKEFKEIIKSNEIGKKYIEFIKNIINTYNQIISTISFLVDFKDYKEKTGGYDNEYLSEYSNFLNELAILNEPILKKINLHYSKKKIYSINKIAFNTSRFNKICYISKTGISNILEKTSIKSLQNVIESQNIIRNIFNCLNFLWYIMFVNIILFERIKPDNEKEKSFIEKMQLKILYFTNKNFKPERDFGYNIEKIKQQKKEKSNEKKNK